MLIFEGFEHDFPEDFEGDDFDFDIFSGTRQFDGFELFEQIGSITLGADGIEVSFGHLDHHFDHAVAAEGVVTTEIAISILI